MILTINGGSSTIKFAAFTAGEKPERLLAGVAHSLADILGHIPHPPHAIGHRIVHGGTKLNTHQFITPSYWLSSAAINPST